MAAGHYAPGVFASFLQPSQHPTLVLAKDAGDTTTGIKPNGRASQELITLGQFMRSQVASQVPSLPPFDGLRVTHCRGRFVTR